MKEGLGWKRAFYALATLLVSLGAYLKELNHNM